MCLGAAHHVPSGSGSNIGSPPPPHPLPNLLRMTPRHQRPPTQPRNGTLKWNNSKTEAKSAWIAHRRIRQHPHRLETHKEDQKTPTNEKTKGEITSGRFDWCGDLPIKRRIAVLPPSTRSTRPAPIHCPSRLSSLDLVRRGTKITGNRRELSATCTSHLYPFDGEENEKAKQTEQRMGLHQNWIRPAKH